MSWIGETYFALGETVSSDAAKSTAFYDKAGAAFGDILTKAAADPNFATTDQLLGVKIRQVRVLRFKKEFQSAETLTIEVIKALPNDIKVQFAACEVYQDWGASGQADSAKKLLTAIRGNKSIGVWGWGEISAKLQKSSAFKTDPAYVERFLDARFNGAQARQRYARDLPPKDRQKELDRCLMELITTSSVMKEMSDERFAKFNSIYREVLQESGKPATDLPRSQNVPVIEPVKAAPVEKPVETAKTKDKKTAEPAPKTSDSTTIVILIVTCVLGLLGMGWFFFKPKSKPKATALKAELELVSFSGTAVGDARPATGFVAPPGAAPKPRQRPASATAGTATKPVARPGATGAAPAPKPKPPAPPSGA